MLGQRWEYRIGNAIMLVDNAFNYLGLGQERFIVNGETVSETSGWFGIYRSFGEPWLTHLGEGELRAVLSSRMLGIACAVTLDGLPIEAAGLWEASWKRGRQKWPPESEWREARGNRWIA